MRPSFQLGLQSRLGEPEQQVAGGYYLAAASHEGRDGVVPLGLARSRNQARM